MTGSGALTAGETPEKPQALVLIGYVLAVVLPIIGIVVGLVAATRPSRWARRHGTRIIVLSVTVIALGIAVMPALIDRALAPARQELRALQREAARNSQRYGREAAAELAKLRAYEATLYAHLSKPTAKH